MHTISKSTYLLSMQRKTKALISLCESTADLCIFVCIVLKNVF